MTRFALIFLLTLTVAVPGAQQQEPQPDQHRGQPDYCVNVDGFPDKPMTPAHECACECMEDGTEDRKCKVWCRKDRCSCIHECDIPQPEEPTHTQEN